MKARAAARRVLMARFCSATILRSLREYCGFFSSCFRRFSAVGNEDGQPEKTVQTRAARRTFAVLLRIQGCIQQLGDVLDVCGHVDSQAGFPPRSTIQIVAVVVKLDQARACRRCSRMVLRSAKAAKLCEISRTGFRK